jgi:hypothetical protein
MTQADSVHSTPRETASKINPPVDPTRRRLLTVAAGGAVAAAIPTALLAAAPAVDPIYTVIERHRAACEAHSQAVHIEFAYEADTVLVSKMNAEQLKEYCALAEVTSAASDHKEDAGDDLVNTKPTTLAGIAALCRYVEPLFNDEDMHNLPEVLYWDDDTQSTPAAAFANVIAAAAKALIEAQAGQAVQS